MATASKKVPDSTKTTSTVKKTATETQAAPKPKSTATTKTAVVTETATKAKKAPATKKSAAKKLAVSPEHRYHMIATAAYFLAERRGFAGGYEMQDWISAEAQIDAQLNT